MRTSRTTHIGILPGQSDKVLPHPQPLRVVGEVFDWQEHSSEVLQHMRDHLEGLKQLGIEAIND